MSKEDRKDNNGKRTGLSRRIMLSFLAAVIIYTIALVVIILLARAICRVFIWQPYDPIYVFLAYVRDNIELIGGIILLGGWGLISRHFISKPLNYLDEVVSATEALIAPTAEPIVLSDEMFSTEVELNRVREKALENMRNVKEAEQRKNDLVMYLAHDLKTPLSSVIGYLTLLRDEQEISPELRERYLSISLDKAERLEDLINEFFEITRFNLSEITLQYSRINLTRLLEQLVFEFKPMLSAKDLTCSLQADEDIMLRCDGDKIQRVFDNLLRNAVLYCYPGTQIEITTEQTDEMVVIRFKDHGDTIPEEKLSRIFEQFYRLDSARSSAGGAGLGLAIAKQIVERHGGTIDAVSEDETVEFSVTLPLL